MTNTKDQRIKNNKENFSFLTLTVNVMELKSNKKAASPPLAYFYIKKNKIKFSTPPPLPQSDLFLESLTPSLIREGSSNYEFLVLFTLERYCIY